MNKENHLRTCRLLTGYRQIDLAKRIKCSQQAISAMEIGRLRPSKRLLRQLERTFGVPGATIFPGDNDE